MVTGGAPSPALNPIIVPYDYWLRHSIGKHYTEYDGMRPVRGVAFKLVHYRIGAQWELRHRSRHLPRRLAADRSL